MHPGPTFEIRQEQAEGGACLKLMGELDLATAPELEDRLRQLRAQRMAVRLDLSDLDFMDSTGLRVLVQATSDARQDGWQLEVLDDIAPQVRRLLQLVELEGLILGRHSAGP